MQETKSFQSELLFDLPAYLEFSKLNVNAHLRNTIMHLCVSACLIYLISMLGYVTSPVTLLLLSLLWVGIHLFQWYRSRRSGLDYQRMLRSNNGNIPRQIVLVDESGIRSGNPDTGKEMTDSFDAIRYMMESKRLLVLVNDLKMCHILDKSNLQGGSREELIAFLREKCPRLRKRIRSGALGRFSKYLCIAVTLLALLFSLAHLFHIPEKLSGQLTNDMSYGEIAQELAEIGIIISDQTIAKLEQYDAENRAGMYLDSNSRILDLLCWEGQGLYEKNVFYQDGLSEAYDWNWTPSPSGVYWFDTEVFNFGSIYADFLAGICAMDEQLAFSNIEEKYIRVDIPSGKGEIDFSFDYEGTHYELIAEYNYDWFDTDMLYAVGKILANDDDPKDLWFTHDGGQGLLLYYGTEENMQLLEKITGTDFFDCVTMHMGH